MAIDRTEYEGKILDIGDPEALRGRILEVGNHVGDLAFRRYVYNTIPVDPARWLRLRTDGTETALTLKNIRHDGVDGTDEWEVAINSKDFDTIHEMLGLSGLPHKGYQENRRHEYRVNGLSVCVDEWPFIPPYMEIEGPDKPAVEATAELLGFDPALLTGMNTIGVYQQYGLDMTAIPDLRFPTPAVD